MISGSIAECLAVWVVVAVVLLWSQWRWGGASCGLPFAYIVGLGIIHVPGAVLYLDPSYEFYNPQYVETGFQITTLGIVGFTVGVLLAGTRARIRRGGNAKSAHSDTVLRTTAPEINRLAWIFLVAGFVVQYVLTPALQGLFLTGLLSGLAQLTVAGTCLGLYAAHISGDHALLRRWLMVACAFPIITLLASAFLGYGIFALLVVASFAIALFRPRLWTVIPFTVAVLIGISVFVTYARDRGDYRAAVSQEGATIKQRLERIVNTFANFEFIDLENPKHRASIDLRLNQNDLVGSAEAHIDSGRADYAAGETFWVALAAPIPRLLWPDKPVFGGSGNTVAEYTGYSFDDATSVGMGQVLEFFINFGWAGEFWCYVLFGALCRRLDMHAGFALREGEFRRFLLFFMPAMGFMQSGGALAEVVASAAGAFFSALLASALADRYIRRIRAKARDALLTQQG
jgi:hypothetical protein